MNQEEALQIVHRYLEHEIPDDVDLWPAIQARVQRTQPVATQVGQRARSRVFPDRWATRSGLAGVAAMIAVLVFGLFAASPTVRARIADSIQRYFFVLEDPDFAANDMAPPLETGSSMEGQSGTGADTRPNRGALVALDEAQQQVRFDIPELTWLPDGVTLQGVLVAGPKDLAVVYRPSAEVEENVTLQVTVGHPEGGYIIDPRTAQDVQVGEHPAVYARRADASTGVDLVELSWADDRFTYMLSAFNLHLDQADMIRIAESVR